MIDTSLIFNHRHKVVVPSIATLNDKDINERGIIISGEPSIDSMALRAPTVVYATIAEQITYWEQGYYVSIKSAEVSLAIVKSIRTYLRQWDNISKGSYNKINKPVEDLASLDEYAVSLEKLLIARGVMTENKIQGRGPFDPKPRDGATGKNNMVIFDKNKKERIKPNPSVSQSQYVPNRVTDVNIDDYKAFTKQRRI
jgi:hypothetical protein